MLQLLIYKQTYTYTSANQILLPQVHEETVRFFRSDSMSGILMQLPLSSFDTVIHNSRVLFESHCSLSRNSATVHLRSFS